MSRAGEGWAEPSVQLPKLKNTPSTSDADVTQVGGKWKERLGACTAQLLITIADVWPWSPRLQALSLKVPEVEPQGASGGAAAQAATAPTR
eukprot:364063-Chlamydomonas_euryale.AAC.8